MLESAQVKTAGHGIMSFMTNFLFGSTDTEAQCQPNRVQELLQKWTFYVDIEKMVYESLIKKICYGAMCWGCTLRSYNYQWPIDN